MNKGLILGGTGYLGFNIANSLSASYSFTLTGKKTINHQLQDFLNSKNITFSQAEIVKTRRIFELIDVNDLVIFCVPNTQPHQKRRLLHSDINRIVTPARKIFQYISRQNKRVIFLSSGGSVYGPGGPNPHSEFSNPIPNTKYGRLKLILDKELLSLNQKFNLNHIIIRLSNPFGGTLDNLYKQGFVNSLIRNIHSGKAIELWGDGNQIRDFLYIKDFTDFVERVLQFPNLGGVFNCGSGVGLSLNEVIQKSSEIIGHPIAVNFNGDYREKIKSNILDVQKARKVLDWYPKHEFNSIFKDLLLKRTH
jgi:UDP-glucose 4-epimerase